MNSSFAGVPQPSVRPESAAAPSGSSPRNRKLRSGGWAAVLKRVRAAVKVTAGVGLAVLTMNLAAMWIYDLPSAFNPLFGDVHQPGREFRQRIEGNGSGVFTSDCVRRASLSAGQKPVLLVLGNSYVEATQVGDKEHFAHLLEQRLGGPLVLPLGVSSYSVADYIARAATFKKSFRPDWVIIPIRAVDFGERAWNKNKGSGYAFFKWANQPAPGGTRDCSPGNEAAATPLDPLQLVSAPVSRPGWLSTETRTKLPFWYPLIDFAYLRESVMVAWAEGHDRPWFHAATEKPDAGPRPDEGLGKYPVAEEMKLLAQAYDGRLTLLYLPDFDPQNPSRESANEMMLQGLAQKDGVRFVSLREEFPALARAGHAPYGFDNTRFNWGHWDCYGHAAAADVLFRETQQLTALGKFPAPAAVEAKQTDLPGTRELVAASPRRSQGVK